MTTHPLYDFNRLASPEQLTLTFSEGTYLASRLDEKSNVLLLYYLGNFFVEVYYESEIEHLYRCRSFMSTTPLQAYVDDIRLPSL